MSGESPTPQTGVITRVAGPVVEASGLAHVSLYDAVRVGELNLIGEVIRLRGARATIQVYEDTAGVRVGESVRSTGHPLVAWLGPGLLGTVFDGLQRPLVEMREQGSAFVRRGTYLPSLSPERRWTFEPGVTVGSLVGPGDVIGAVQESQTIRHRIAVPPGVSGRVERIEPGDFTVDEAVAAIRPDHDHTGALRPVTLMQAWPVRRPRPIRSRLHAREPMVTGLRIIDSFFPIAKGGTAIIPGGFGTGKTVIQHCLARWANIDVVVYVGCGERGNEMTQVLEEFPSLEDPRTGSSLMSRTVLIANTSNMPVAAREASIYMGITIAEYYRDMGYDVLLLADSTSRWGEALREISGRLEEIPEEEGYPAYVGARLAEFYERAGQVTCQGEPPRTGSVTVVGAVSPPGADFSEPLTQASMRVAGAFWGLDYELSRSRHFPAINWTSSYTLFRLAEWFGREVAPDWDALVPQAQALLQREAELMQIVQLVGPDALSRMERLILFTARMLRESFLQQSAFDPSDGFCSLEKTAAILRTILLFHTRATEAVTAGAGLPQITGLPAVAQIARMKEIPAAQVAAQAGALLSQLQSDFGEIAHHG